MKVKYFKRISALLLSALALCFAFAIAPLAEEGEVTASISRANVAFNDKIHLVLEVEVQGELAENQLVGITVWENTERIPTMSNASYCVFESSEKDGVTYFKVNGTPEEEIGRSVYVAACIRTGNAISLTETPFLYGVCSYAMDRLNNDSFSEAKEELYTKMIVDGYSSPAVNGGKTVPYCVAKMKNAFTSPERGRYSAAPRGSTVRAWAEAVNAEGKYFLYWENDKGEKATDIYGNLIRTRIADVRVRGEGVVGFTAVYGEAEDSLYGYQVVNYEALSEIGEYELAYTEKTKPQRADYFGTKTEKLFGVEGFSLTNNIHGVNDGNGLYTPGDHSTRLFVTENGATGDRELLLEALDTYVGVYFTVPASTPNARAFEFDVRIIEQTVNGVMNNYNVTLVDADGREFVARINFNLKDITTEYASFTMYTEKGRTTFPKGEDGESIRWRIGETLTYRIEIVEGGEDEDFLAVYINGDRVGVCTASSFVSGGKYEGDFDVMNIVRIKSATMAELKASKGNYSYDNIAFLE